MKFGARRHRRPHRRKQQGIRRSNLLGQFIYNTCTQSLAVCESPAYLDNIANVRTYTQSYGNANYTVNDTLWAVFVQDDTGCGRT